MEFSDLPVIDLSQAEFDELPEYSLTVPTVTSPADITKRNRRWKRKVSETKWAMGSYSVDEQPDGRWLVTHWHQIAIKLEITRKLYDQIIISLTETLEQPFECTCEAYHERDTNAWIHDEEKCWSFMEGHIESTLSELEKLGANVAP